MVGGGVGGDSHVHRPLRAACLAPGRHLALPTCPLDQVVPCRSLDGAHLDVVGRRHCTLPSGRVSGTLCRHSCLSSRSSPCTCLGRQIVGPRGQPPGRPSLLPEATWITYGQRVTHWHLSISAWRPSTAHRGPCRRTLPALESTALFDAGVPAVPWQISRPGATSSLWWSGMISREDHSNTKQ